MTKLLGPLFTDRGKDDWGLLMTIQELGPTHSNTMGVIESIPSRPLPCVDVDDPRERDMRLSFNPRVES